MCMSHGRVMAMRSTNLTGHYAEIALECIRKSSIQALPKLQRELEMSIDDDSSRCSEVQRRSLTLGRASQTPTGRKE